MVKIINLKHVNDAIVKYRKQYVRKNKKIELEKAYEEYIYQGIVEAENEIKNGAKSYSQEEFVEIMRTKYGCII